MKIELENVKPRDIERRSFDNESIDQGAVGDRVLDPDKELIIKRCIHTSADFEYADSLYFQRERWKMRWRPSRQALPS